ncbi:MAG: hypothetical protein KC419_22790, partial [Anaerolineales bacterium]|nr:hypothetical protein [Anaerolineales bacterium]
MKKLLSLIALLWLSACTGQIIDNGTTQVAATATPIQIEEPTPTQPTPTAVSQITAVPTAAGIPTTTAIPPTPVPVTPPTRIQFDPGATSATINSHLAAGESIEYLAWAAATQRMHVEIVSPNNVANFAVEGTSDGQ